MLLLDFFRSMFMTSITGVFRVNRGMTGLAGNFSLASVIEGKEMTLKLGRKPGCGRMTQITLEAKETCMDFRFCMAADTITRNAFPDLILMTGSTIDLGMLAIQDEHTVMIEVIHPVDAIMTVQTGGPELRHMLLHERLILATMTIDTNVDFKYIQAGGVTGHAGNRRVSIILLMPVEVETSLNGMVEWLFIKPGRTPGFRIVATGAL